MTANGQVVSFGPRYGRLRLDGDLDEFHRAIVYLLADTCQGGRCQDPRSAPDGLGQWCAKHQRQAQRRRLREGGGR